MASIDAKYGCSLEFSTIFFPIRASFLSPAPGTNSAMYFIIGIRSMMNTPTLPAFAKVFTADSASPTKGSSIGFVSIPYVIDSAVPPTALSNSSINNYAAIDEIKGTNLLP